MDADSSLDHIFFPDIGVVSVVAVYAERQRHRDGDAVSVGRRFARPCKPSSAAKNSSTSGFSSRFRGAQQDCPPSAPLRQRAVFIVGRDFWIIVAARSEDETEIRAGEKQPAEDAIRDIRRATRRRLSAEEKIRIVLEGLRGEESIAELCRREGIAYSSRCIMAGRRSSSRPVKGGLPATRRARDFRRGEGSPRGEAQALKEVVADLTLENRLLKKSMIADGGDEA